MVRVIDPLATPLRALAFAGALGGAATLASGSVQAAQDYEVWALDQGTALIHIYNAELEEVDRIDLGAEGIEVPHMVDFTSDHSYAFVANAGSNDVTVIRTEDREIVAQLDTGPRTHMAAVAPDDSHALVAVIGSPDEQWDGKMVEIAIDLDEERFELGRSLTIADDPLFQEQQDAFSDSGPICQDFTADSRHAYITLGPGLGDGGLVVLDTESFELIRAFGPDTLQVNCGTILTQDERHMIVNGGGPETGVWYALDVETHEVVHQADSEGLDAHGVWAVPGGNEIWMVNRVTDNAIVIDSESLEIIDEMDFVGETPDIIGMSPDGERAFVSLRGPNPVTAAHVATGSTPGFAVIDVNGRELLEIVQPNPEDAESDFHGIGVRFIHD